MKSSAHISISSIHSIHEYLAVILRKNNADPFKCCLIYLDNLVDSVNHFGYSYVLEIEHEYIAYIESALPNASSLFRIGIGLFVCISNDLVALQKSLTRIEAMRFISGKKAGDLGLKTSVVEHAILSDKDVTLKNIDTLINSLSIKITSTSLTGEHSTDFLDRNQTIGRLLLDSNLDEEFEIYIQPVVSLSDETIISGEALLRWHSPILGNVSPAVFIPIAEDLNLIDDMTFFVFRQVGNLLKSLGDSGSTKIAINLSPKSIVKPIFRKHFIDLVKNAEFTQSLLTIEITERQYLSLDSEIQIFFTELQKIGVKLSIDDFGDGAASMNYLRLLPVEHLKISGELSNLFQSVSSSDLLWLKGVINMAHLMGSKVIVEGLNTKLQVETAKSLDADYVQGYFFYKPMDLLAFAKIIKNNITSI